MCVLDPDYPGVTGGSPSTLYIAIKIVSLTLCVRELACASFATSHVFVSVCGVYMVAAVLTCYQCHIRSANYNGALHALSHNKALLMGSIEHNSLQYRHYFLSVDQLDNSHSPLPCPSANHKI